MVLKLKIELISIGDELLSGKVADLNGPFLANYLFKNGLNLSRISICHDSFEEIEMALKIALSRSQIVLTSGGMGPTKDDITKKSISRFFHKKIIPSKEAELITLNNYQQFGKNWNKDKNHYHMIPEDFIPLKNLSGLAPGLIYHFEEKKEKGKKVILMAPGVPTEFQMMLKHSFFPFIKKEYQSQIKKNQQITIRTHGVPEEKIFKKHYPDLWKDFSQYGKVSSLPQATGVDIIVTLKESKNFKTSFEEIVSLIQKTPLKDYVWQYGELTLPELIIKQFKQKNKTFSFAESCTGGLSSSKITDVPGSSAVFLGSIVSYSNQLKEEILDVKNQTLKSFGAISEEVVKEMALGTILKTKSDFAISWSGLAGPGGGNDQTPIGTLVLGWVKKGEKPQSEKFKFNGERTRLKELFSQYGLAKLLSLIREIDK